MIFLFYFELVYWLALSRCSRMARPFFPKEEILVWITCVKSFSVETNFNADIYRNLDGIEAI